MSDILIATLDQATKDRRWDEDAWIRRFQSHKKSLKNFRGRRYVVCSAIGEIQDAIDHLGQNDPAELYPELHPEDFGPPTPNDMLKQELKNVSACLLRTFLLYNDGHVSSQELRSF